MSVKGFFQKKLILVWKSLRQDSGIFSNSSVINHSVFDSTGSNSLSLMLNTDRVIFIAEPQDVCVYSLLLLLHQQYYSCCSCNTHRPDNRSGCGILYAVCQRKMFARHYLVQCETPFSNTTEPMLTLKMLIPRKFRCE